jgi:hypothetical protein
MTERHADPDAHCETPHNIPSIGGSKALR